MKTTLRKFAKGSMTVQTLGMILLTLMGSALAIDFSYYYAAQNQMQTAANAASLAATMELYRNTSVDLNDKLTDATTTAEDFTDENMPGTLLEPNDVAFGYIDPATKIYDPNNFRNPTNDPGYSQTGGYNAVWVRVRYANDSANGPLNTLMANMLGIRHMNTQATAVALIDQTVNSVTNGGLRPMYVCEAQFNATMTDGIPENNVVRIYGDHTEVDGVGTFAGCPAMGSGNWGFADFTDCDSGTVGASTIREWFANGYPGTVTAGQCYSTKPGNFISSISDELDTLIANHTIFPLPLYNSWSGNGSNGQVDVSGFVGFQMTGYKANGSQASRYIEGRFTRYVCTNGCTAVTSGGSTPGGSVVKVRLASRS